MRARRRVHVLALAAAASAVLIAGCASANRLTISQLAEREQALSGQQVHTHGIVRFRRGRGGGAHLVLEGGSGEEVVLKPVAAVKRYLGEKVAVTGRFEATPFVGRLIEVGRVRRGADAAAPGASRCASGAPAPIDLGCHPRGAAPKRRLRSRSPARRSRDRDRVERSRRGR